MEYFFTSERFLKFMLIAIVGLAAFFVGIGIGSSHKSVYHRKPSVEHCIPLTKGVDYRDIECPSGTYRLYGDTLRVRLHT